MSTRNIHVNTASYTLLVAGKKKNTGEEWDVLEFSSLTELKKYRKSHPEKMAFSQLAFADGDVLVTGEMNESERASFLSTLNKMAEKKKNTGKEMFVGVTRVLSDDESKVFFEKIKARHPEMDIKIPFLTVMETLQYKPAESAASVQCPVLVVIAGQDSVNPPEQGKALYDAVASGTKELYEEADACHYDIYEGAFFERVAAVQTQWFKKHL